MVGSNTSLWDGDGNEFTELDTIVEGGMGDDHLIIAKNAPGSFQFVEEQVRRWQRPAEARGGTNEM